MLEICWRKVIGTSVGCLSASGNDSRNFDHCCRERESALTFFIPSMCTPLNKILCNNPWRTKGRSRCMICLDLEVFELRIDTKALLSVWRIIFFPWNWLAQIVKAMTIGTSSKNVTCLKILEFFHSCGHNMYAQWETKPDHIRGLGNRHYQWTNAGQSL